MILTLVSRCTKQIKTSAVKAKARSGIATNKDLSTRTATAYSLVPADWSSIWKKATAPSSPVNNSSKPASSVTSSNRL